MASMTGAADAIAPQVGEDPVEKDPLFQYIVLRRDLQEKQDWPLGALVAQGSHAAIAAVVQSLPSADTQAYVAPSSIDNMHKGVLEVKNLAALEGLATRLDTAGVGYKLWCEMPEDTPTCLATEPGRKSKLQPHFKKGCSLSAWHVPKAPKNTEGASKPRKAESEDAASK